MKLEKNWFYYFSIALSIVGLLYIIVCGFRSIGEGQEYPYLLKGLLILGIFFIWISVWLFSVLAARFSLWEKLSYHKKWAKYSEWIFVLLILVLSFVIRYLVVDRIPMKPASDYKTYYEIAVLLTEGTIQKLGKGYCDYVAMFPHVMGYCYILMLAFKTFGTSVLVGQYLNIFFAVGTVFITYKIARKTGGRIAGIAALLLCAFWPSQVLYITMLSAEYSFTFFFYLCIWIFVSLVKDYDGNTENSVRAVALHIILGLLLAATAAIRPMAMLLLIAIILTIVPQKMKLPPIPLNDIPLTIRVLEKGWMRCVMIIIPYLLLSGIISSNIELTVDRTLPSSSTSFGYNLLVGLNTQSKGGWNDDDAALLYASLEETGSASQAHIACRDLALQRLKSNPVGIFNLFIEKYELLWGNDDYGTTWNLAFLEEQGELTEERKDFLYAVRDINGILYLVTVFFSLIALIYIWRSKATIASILPLIYLGTVAMHLLVESQNRYHYFVIQIFMILGGVAAQYLFVDEKRKRNAMIREEELLLKEQELKALRLHEFEEEEEQLNELRKEAYSNVFDMDYALKSGHIIMTVSEGYKNADIKDKDPQEKKQVKDKKPEREEETENKKPDEKDEKKVEEILNSHEEGR